MTTKLTQQLKDMWLAELRDPNNAQIKRAFVMAKGHYEWGMQSDIHKPSPKTAHICTNEQEPMQKASCMCAAGCLIKAHAKLSAPYEYVGIDAIHALPPRQIQYIYHLNDTEDKSLAEIADWVEQNCAVAV